jgi:arylsulfatase A-like enzyme
MLLRRVVVLYLLSGCTAPPSRPLAESGGIAPIRLDRTAVQVRASAEALRAIDGEGQAPLQAVRQAQLHQGWRREGLALAPGIEVELLVDVPPGAKLETRVSARGPTGDGAVLVVRAGDAELGRIASQPGKPAVPWTIEIPSGSQRIRLLVEPGAQVGADALFLAHPQIRANLPDPRRMVWIGLDTLRKDRVGVYGYDRPTTPHLDQFARSAIVFDDAVAPAPRTRPSFHSALTGQPPLRAVGAPTILGDLADAGFITAGIVANPHLDPRFGFADGAASWHLDPAARADEQVDLALRWLREHQQQDAALFLHIMDPHLPYDPPEVLRNAWVRDPDPRLPVRFNRETVLRWGRQGLLDDRRKAHISDLYDAEIRHTDEALGRLFSALDQLPGRTVVVIHSDHGEELWDHGGFEHNHTLYPEVLDAVLLVRAPHLLPRRVSEPVTLSQIAPALLELFGLPAGGRPSLFPAFVGDALPDRAHGIGLLMYDYERWGVREGPYTYTIRTLDAKESLYDRRPDPREMSPRTDVDLARFRASTASAHGLDLGPGWRITGRFRAPFTLRLPQPARGAGVLDPEALSPHRANLEWGEKAPVTPDQVASVSLSADGTEVSVVPGPHGEGTLWVRFDAPTPIGGQVDDGIRQAPLDSGENAGLPGITSCIAESGLVLVPPPGEFARREALAGRASALDPATRALLEDLGYVGGGTARE